MLDLFAHRNLSKVLVSACASEKQIRRKIRVTHTHLLSGDFAYNIHDLAREQSPFPCNLKL
jgi:hypothetical protein